MESLPNQLYHRSTGIATHKPIPYETGVARGEEQKHARRHSEYNGPKNPLYVGHDPQVFLYYIELQDRLDTPNFTH